MITYYSDLAREMMESITQLELATSYLTDGIAGRIDAVMKCKGISKVEEA